jgi:hypothetical protein
MRLGGPRTDLDDVEGRKIVPLPGLELRTLGRPASSLSLYRLRYPGSQCHLCTWLKKLIKHSKFLFRLTVSRTEPRSYTGTLLSNLWPNLKTLLLLKWIIILKYTNFPTHFHSRHSLNTRGKILPSKTLLFTFNLASPQSIPISQTRLWLPSNADNGVKEIKLSIFRLSYFKFDAALWPWGPLSL